MPLGKIQKLLQEEKEKQVMSVLNDEEKGYTLQQVGDMFGLTKQRIHQIRNKHIKTLD